MTIDYQKSIIYKIECLKTNRCYVGSTTGLLCNRKACHLYHFKCYNENKRKQYITSFSILAGGNYEFKVIEKYPCNSRKELLKRERKYIDELNSVNKIKPCRTKKQWNEDNKLKLEKYYFENREKILQQKKDYYYKNIDKVKANMKKYREKGLYKQYYQDHKQALMEYQRQYRLKYPNYQKEYRAKRKLQKQQAMKEKEEKEEKVMKEKEEKEEKVIKENI